MIWKTLLAEERATLPWLGGRTLRRGPRVWEVEGPLPPEEGWYEFRLARTALWVPSDPLLVDGRFLAWPMPGYLVGDWFLGDGVHAAVDPKTLTTVARHVRLVPALERFVRVEVGLLTEEGPLLFLRETFPLGPETEVLAAYEDGAPNLDKVRGVPPSLDAAFRLASYQRAEAEARRQQLAAEAAALAAAEALAAEREALAAKLGSAQGRRLVSFGGDFTTAAAQALAVGGAEYLDHRPYGRSKNEMAVRFRLLNRRFECICNLALRIIDSGICLVDHHTGERGDTRFTLETLPSVIREAHRDGRLVVFRHV